jgi:hypothetical protein
MAQTARKLMAVAAMAGVICLASTLWAQQNSSGANRVLGTVASVSGNTVSVKTDAGTTVSVTVPDTARILRTAPGQKSLAGATKIAVGDIAEGDRVLMVAAGDPPTASIVVVNKKSDLAAKQQQEEADWQRRGVGGIVKSVDSANNSVTIASGARTITIHSTPQTMVRRYAPDSVKFSDAKPSTLAAIQPGDQLQARGEKSADGSQVTAEEIVSGSFRNIAGTVVSVNAGEGTLKVKDLMTKKEVTIHTTPDSDLRKLDPQMAQMIALRLKSGGAPAGHGGGMHQAADHESGEAAGGHRQPGAAAPEGAGQRASGPGASGSAANGGSAGMLARVLQRSPEIHVGDLHKGDAVMIVATSGTPDAATAIRLVTGVEPMLEASASGSQSMFSSAWSLGGGSGGDQGGDTGQQP